MHQAPAPVGATWRRMGEDDLPAVCAIAARVYPDHSEKAAIFAERLRLYPESCRVLDTEGRAAGYALGHPWLFGRPPRLNSSLGALPGAPTTFHLHDVALLPAARGAGATSRLLWHLAELARAAGLPSLSLVAVNGSAAFWERRGFRAVQDPALGRELRSYGPATLLMRRSLP